ncbi:MAG: PaaI family thioesterase [Acidimicrobiia bacterium]|nr:PaaI family thioesterase [Acidimicrobiia bacterium]MDH5292177.1 PaaI family thioesterase [Acidimicrobiia bacterium]
MDFDQEFFPNHIGLEITEATPDLVAGRLDATVTHQQPQGVTHGGVHASIVETLASVGGALWAMEQGMATVVGVSNTTDFIRPHFTGWLHGVATPVHRGRTQQIWMVEVTNDAGKLVARGHVRLQNLAQPHTES